MGVVYLAGDPVLGRQVALKTVSLSFAASAEEKEGFERRFLAEARAVAALSHPGIVTIHDVGRVGDTASLYIAFELLRGRPLSDVVAGGAHMGWREALGITAFVAEALHHAHERGIVHRDVKPANIMLPPTGPPKIMDFGVAKVATQNVTIAGEFFGTPSFMSPEQLAGEELDGRSDLFSLGAVLYCLLTGRSAFDGQSVPATLARVLHYEPPAPSSIVAGVPPAVDRIVARALSKDRSRRYADGPSMARDARAAMGESSGIGSEANARSASTNPRRRKVLWGAAAAAIGVAIVLAGRWSTMAILVPLPAAQLEVDLEHPLRSGVLKVWVDDELVVEEPLESRVTEDLFVVKLRAGRERKTVDVTPGQHEVRLEVSGDDFSASRSISGVFESGATRRLGLRVSGLLRKELSVWWRT